MLYDKHKAEGLEVLSFPSNDFFQDRGDEASNESANCRLYKTTFPVFSRVKVTGASAEPLFSFLTSRPGMEVGVSAAHCHNSFPRPAVIRCSSCLPVGQGYLELCQVGRWKGWRRHKALRAV
jgi:hypothetical protein